MQIKNAASVFPEPVGAETSVVFCGENARPALLLRLGRCAEAGNKPIADERVSPFQAGESRLRYVGVHDAELNYSATGPVAADGGSEKEAFEADASCRDGAQRVAPLHGCGSAAHGKSPSVDLCVRVKSGSRAAALQID